MQLKTCSVMLIIFVYVSLIGGSIYAQTILKPDEGVRKISWSPDGQKIATANPDGLVRIWNTNGQLITSFIAHENGTRAVVWSPDGTRLATGGADNVVKIWDDSGVLLSSFETYFDGVFDILWFADGNRLFTLGFNIASIWDSSSGELLTHFFLGTMYDITISVDDSKISIIALNDTLSIINANSYEHLYSVDLSDEIETYAIDWSPDNSRIAIGNVLGTVRIWDVINQTDLGVIADLDSRIKDMKYSSDGTLLAVALDDGSAGGIVQILDADTGTIVKTYTAHGVVLDLEWSPHGDRIAFVGVENDTDPNNDITIYASPISDLTYNPLSAEG